jgi:hypothetical protein
MHRISISFLNVSIFCICMAPAIGDNCHIFEHGPMGRNQLLKKKKTNQLYIVSWLFVCKSNMFGLVDISTQ